VNVGGGVKVRIKDKRTSIWGSNQFQKFVARFGVGFPRLVGITTQIIQTYVLG